MKFDYVIGNPPYQENIKNRSEQPPVYNLFFDASFGISKKVLLITPGRFLFNAGKTPKDWNRKMLNDKHFKVLKYEENSRTIFPSVDIKGGVAITYRDEDSDFGAIRIFVKNNFMSSIVTKVKHCSKNFLNEITISNTSYKYSNKVKEDFPQFFVKDENGKSILSGGSCRYMSSSVFDKVPEMFTEEKPVNERIYAKIIGRQNNKRVSKYILLKYINPPKNFYSYKVFLAGANGSGEFGEKLSSPFVAEPYTGSSETFMSIGDFKTKTEAENLIKYIKTKFARALLCTLKVTQSNAVETWSNIPIQNFTNESDIDWSKSIHEIDLQLYKKYGLGKKEVQFIEKTMKPME